MSKPLLDFCRSIWMIQRFESNNRKSCDSVFVFSTVHTEDNVLCQIANMTHTLSLSL